MENGKERYESSGIMNGLQLGAGFGSEYISNTSSNKSINKITVDEVRRILNEALGGISLYDYVQQERNERY